MERDRPRPPDLYLLWERAPDFETNPEFREAVSAQAQALADSEQVPVALVGEPKENLTPDDFLASFEPKPRG